MLAALLLALLCAGVSACSRPEPEQALRDRIAAMQQAAAQRSADGVLRGVAEEFIGPHGMDRDGLGRMLRLQFLAHGSVGVRLGPVSVELHGDRARAGFTAVLTGGSGRLVPDTGRIYQVDTVWRLQRGEWVLVSADWE